MSRRLCCVIGVAIIIATALIITLTCNSYDHLSNAHTWRETGLLTFAIGLPFFLPGSSRILDSLQPHALLMAGVMLFACLTGHILHRSSWTLPWMAWSMFGGSSNTSITNIHYIRLQVQRANGRWTSMAPDELLKTFHYNRGNSFLEQLLASISSPASYDALQPHLKNIITIYNRAHPAPEESIHKLRIEKVDATWANENLIKSSTPILTVSMP